MRRGGKGISRNKIISLHEVERMKKNDISHKSNKDGQASDIKVMIVTVERNIVASR